MQFRYAARNLSRHRLRTAFTIMAVAFAVGLVVVGNCFITGLGDFSLAEFTRFTGHVELRHTDYQKRWRFKPLDYNISSVQALREKLVKIDGANSNRRRENRVKLPKRLSSRLLARIVGPEIE